MRTFTRLRQLISTHMERGIKSHDRQIKAIFEALRELINPPESGRKIIGFRPGP